MKYRLSRKDGPTTGCPTAGTVVLPCDIMARFKALRYDKEPLWHVLTRLMDAYEGEDEDTIDTISSYVSGRLYTKDGPNTGGKSARSFVLPCHIMARFKALRYDKEPLWHVLTRLMDAYEGKDERMVDR